MYKQLQNVLRDYFMYEYLDFISGVPGVSSGFRLSGTAGVFCDRDVSNAVF